MASPLKPSALKAELKRVIAALREKDPELTDELLHLQAMIARRAESATAGPYSEIASPQEAILTVLREHRPVMTKRELFSILIEGGFRRSLEATDIRKLVDTSIGNMLKTESPKIVLGPGKGRTRAIALKGHEHEISSI